MGRLDVSEVLIIVGLASLIGLLIHNWMYRHNTHLHR
jgi:FtsZ-interacting cell division protein ZipA